MSKIIKLDKNLANQIAAGEVVERPISVIKELVENSIDAKSKNIVIEIKNGGLDFISIKDNGIGIEKEDLELVCEKYSTSKIKNLDDLYHVMTFGFRGEAMASISSVSDTRIISKNINSDIGYDISYTGGEKEGNIIEAAIDIGTKIIVKKLFYNTPARLNYLKKPRTEYNHILSYLYEASLSYPNVGFEFISDGKTILKYRENENLKTRIYNIYGNDFFNNSLEIIFEMEGIKISGFISDPKVCFQNKNKQNLFVNKRPIKSYMISKSINDAYNRFIPHGTNPGFVLNIEINPEEVDVNVHPRKLEVRFANEQKIFRAVYHSIQDKLENVSLVNKSYENTEKTPELSNQTNTINSFSSINKENNYYTGSGTKFKSYSPYKDTKSHPDQQKIYEANSFSKAIGGDNIDKEYSFEISNDLHDTKLGKIIGQAHNSYIIVETKDGIKFLDQHALAERVIYEKLVKKEIKNSTQGLLIGENIYIMPKEIDILKDNIDTFYEMGFDFEILPGNNIIINGIPDFIKRENIKTIFIGILEDIGTWGFNKSNTLEEVKNKIFAYTACRSAIKFGNKLNLFEMNKLLNDSAMDYSATCPHGRPVVFDINLEELKNKYERS